MALNFDFNRFHPSPYIRLPNRLQFQDLPNPFLLQGFEYYVVIDFEATCDKERNLHPQEIIEFPSVVVSGVSGEIIACFQTYVRPTFDPLLTNFCKELTGIQQHQVDNGITLGEALYFHDKWLLQMGLNNTNFSVVTWSDWDCQVMLESECRIKKIQKPAYFNQWINLRVPFSKVFGDVRCNLKEAVELAGLIWQGRVHCGLDDAINIARLLSVIMRRGFKFSITKSLTPQANPNCLTWNRHQFLEPQAMYTPPHTSLIQEFEDCRYCYCGTKSIKR